MKDGEDKDTGDDKALNAIHMAMWAQAYMSARVSTVDVY